MAHLTSQQVQLLGPSNQIICGEGPAWLSRPQCAPSASALVAAPPTPMPHMSRPKDVRAQQPTRSRDELGYGHSGCWPSVFMVLSTLLLPPFLGWGWHGSVVAMPKWAGRGQDKGACQCRCCRVCSLGWKHQDCGGAAGGGMAFGPGQGLLPWAFCPPCIHCEKALRAIHPRDSGYIQEGPRERLSFPGSGSSEPPWSAVGRRASSPTCEA